jgi:Phosphatidylserine/phosphatidylglycerophosphate/cardiolipin synthases and related enzymes
MRSLGISKVIYGGLVFFTATMTAPTAFSMPVEDLHLHSIEDYPLDATGKPQNFFLVSNSIMSAKVVLDSKLVETVKPDYPGEMVRSFIRGDISCDQNFAFRSDSLFSKDEIVKERSFTFRNNKDVTVTLSPKVSECILTFSDKKNPSRRGGVRLIREDKAFPFIKSLNTAVQGCDYQIDNGSLPIEKLFLTADYRNMTCAKYADSIETLETPESGFRAKAEALLGSHIDDAFIKNQNPYAPLDMSHAPKLDAVFVASLVYRNDFYGTVITRLLKYHADRGTLVHVMTTGWMQSDKDRALLYTAARENGNFRLQEYTFHDPKGGFKGIGRRIDNKFRDMHIKLFVTLSAQNPEDNVVILGGRNIHDGFLFREKPNYTKFPQLTQYGVDENFVHWSDFEIKMKSASLARSTFAHLQTFWNRDTMTQVMPSINAPAKGSSVVAASEVLRSDKPMMRHIISVPFSDDRALEKLFVEMIDKASSTIELSSPYLRPTPAIAAAFDRAVGRGVHITIQTRIDLKGDTMDWLYTEVNKESINALSAKAKVYEWTGNSILHSKFILVDGKFAFIGSVNLSRRSFIQDIENGFMIHDENFVRKMQGIFNGYTSKSRLISEQQARKFWGSLIVYLIQDQF